MKLTKLEVIGLWNAIDKCKEHKNTKFIYGALKTKRLIKDEVEMLQELITASKKYTEYQRLRVKLCGDFGEKENGVLLVEDGNYVFTPDGKALYEESLKQLKERFQDWIDEREEQVRNYNTILKEAVEVDIHQVALMDVPENLNAEVMEYLIPMIKE